ncbi:MarR family winged helix-turn-helix transcriptional regulator [Pediococcus ethanolidurans]|uniref:MarR family winged helix-turn-helix transcriptional regulator n=1 Tax=Pediococcus ethanolidurans TaxID=319653 RepID=UPI001C1EF160|nr:MarR family transcriptional regulator [Pediococcus ethanolidurans]MBU7554017.1 MarR family transcriptional regulator [Pediococcus ethanolidurans]MBU7563144.1 MarR family transcriptional regulator [Pediococcus ethanolidurans]MCT4398236.1 MarR family transcriptional regulator [Pediococcus ethanolidurans]MCV3314986.1 MarR family transcriptional regulator [Pediococcus ethanolidurans]MCV3322076.1 MarR family transcriptional regulator [Pediococcus ethanolidurans]
MKTKNNDKLFEGSVEIYMSTLKFLEYVLSEPTKEYEISFEQFLVLRNICNNEKVTQMGIAAQRNVTRSAISRQIKSLLRLGYISQTPDQKDKRKLYLHLTKRGAEVEQLIDRKVHLVFEGWVAKFGQKKVESLLKLLKEFGNQVINPN